MTASRAAGPRLDSWSLAAEAALTLHLVPPDRRSERQLVGVPLDVRVGAGGPCASVLRHCGRLLGVPLVLLCARLGATLAHDPNEQEQRSKNGRHHSHRFLIS